jgi:hypothetical protein
MTTLKRFFLWLFTTIGLILLVIGGVQLLNLALKTYVFTKADYNYCHNYPKEEQIDYTDQCEDQRTADKQRQAANATAMLLIGAPLFVGFIRKAKAE